MSEPFLGEVRLFGFDFAPVGWEPCDGRLLGIAQNDALFALLGTTYGGDGQTTFGLPDLRGQVPLHQGAGIGLSPRTLGEGGGQQSVTLGASQLPAHAHSFSATGNGVTSDTPGTGVQLGQSNSVEFYTSAPEGTPLKMSASSTLPAGSAQPHENTMPTLTVRACIATSGIFPSQN